MWERYKKKCEGCYLRFGRTLLGTFLFRLIHNYNKHNLSGLAAESTYYLILSLVPFFIFFLNCLLFFAHKELPTVLNLLTLLPTDTQEVIQPMVMNLLESRNQAILSIGILMAFWSSAMGVQGLIRSLNIILNIDGRENSFIMMYAKSIFFTLLWTINAIVSLLMTVYGNALFKAVARAYNFPHESIELWNQISLGVPFAVVLVTLAIFYKYAPRFIGASRLGWGKAFLSGIVGTVLWICITLLYRYYIGNLSSMSLTYGPLVGLMALFIWINLSVKAVLFGAEVSVALEDITKAKSKMYDINA